jgi:hypothetical protein
VNARHAVPVVDHLYLGRNYADNQPTLTPLSSLLKNVLVTGNPGSGKSVKLAAIARALIRSGEASVTIFNPKPLENELYGLMDHEVRALRKRKNAPDRFPFLQYSMRPGRASHLLKLFHNREWENLAPGQQAQIIMTALAFSHSRSSEDAFFVDSSRKVVEYALTKARRRDDEVVRSFKRLHELLQPLLHRRNKELEEHLKKHGAHASYLIERLAQIESLNPDEHSAEVLAKGIDLGRFVEEPCFAYFELDSFADPAAAGEVARSTFSSFFAQISSMHRRVPTVHIVDEASSILAGNMADLFRKARATNCGFILAVQSVADLVDGNLNLLPTVLSTTQVQIFMRVSDPVGISLLRELGGQRSEYTSSFGCSQSNDGKRSYSYNLQETLVDRVNMPEIEMVNSDQHLEFMRIIGDEGLARYGSSLFINR